MIYIQSSIEPEKEDEKIVVSISLMRITDEQNEIGEYKYTYGGWWEDRDSNRFYVNGFIYNDRTDVIFGLISKICLDIKSKIKV